MKHDRGDEIGPRDRAHDYYLCINPSAREAMSEVHRCEPYIYAQVIAVRDPPAHGDAKNSWLTGTAAWNQAAITRWILSIRPALDRLRAQPVLPAGWAGFQAVRLYRGARYRIAGRRADEGEAAGLAVDGKPVPGSVVPLPPPGVHERAVELRLQRIRLSWQGAACPRGARLRLAPPAAAVAQAL